MCRILSQVLVHILKDTVESQEVRRIRGILAGFDSDINDMLEVMGLDK